MSAQVVSSSAEQGSTFDFIMTAYRTIVFGTSTPFTTFHCAVKITANNPPQASASIGISTPTVVASEPRDNVRSDHGSGIDNKVAIPLIVLAALLVAMTGVSSVVWRKSRKSRVAEEKPRSNFPYSRAQGDVEKDAKRDGAPSLPSEGREDNSDARSYISDGTTLAPSLRY